MVLSLATPPAADGGDGVEVRTARGQEQRVRLRAPDLARADDGGAGRRQRQQRLPVVGRLSVATTTGRLPGSGRLQRHRRRQR
jgi:hypothetical protein